MNENEESSTAGRFEFLESKFWRVTLMIVAVALIFAGPTYFSYLLADILRVDYVTSVVSGLALLIVGLLLMVILVRKRVIT